MSNMRFVRLYAAVRHHVFTDDCDGDGTAFLKRYMASLERHVATELGLPQTMLVGRLVDLGRDLCEFKSGQDEAE
jgi:hypothetical protein